MINLLEIHLTIIRLDHFQSLKTHIELSIKSTSTLSKETFTNYQHIDIYTFFLALLNYTENSNLNLQYHPRLSFSSFEKKDYKFVFNEADSVIRLNIKQNKRQKHQKYLTQCLKIFIHSVPNYHQFINGHSKQIKQFFQIKHFQLDVQERIDWLSKMVGQWIKEFNINQYKTMVEEFLNNNSDHIKTIFDRKERLELLQGLLDYPQKLNYQQLCEFIQNQYQKHKQIKEIQQQSINILQLLQDYNPQNQNRKLPTIKSSKS